MNLQLSLADQAFLDEVNAFLDAEVPANIQDLVLEPQNPDPDDEFVAGFQRKLAERRWLAMAWPTKYGGLDASYRQQMLYNETMSYRRAPVGIAHGIAWVGPALMLYGSDEQKARHLERIATAQEDWCTLYSEPGAGSDLASLRTPAVRDGDEYVVNGQKIWTSGAHRADFGWLAARTDPEAPKHKGISMFIVDMKSPGISIRPLVNLPGRHNFNEVFFDNVRIPAANLVGEENRGWYTMAAALDFERSSIGTSAGARRTFEDLVDLARGRAAGDGTTRTVRLELAERGVEINVARMLSYRVVSLQERGVAPNSEASIAKLYSSELSQRMASTAMHLIGSHGLLFLGDSHAPRNGRISFSYCSSVASTIAGGTSEIQRGVIAGRGLGLPR
jgi:alkylation response protein AidB-like acyl-CoA dehydrogenase